MEKVMMAKKKALEKKPAAVKKDLAVKDEVVPPVNEVNSTLDINKE